MPTSHPSREQLVSHAARHVAGAVLVLVAAAVTREIQYALIAAALVPQVLVNLLALTDHDRRRKLRVGSRPPLVLVLSAVLLGGTAVALLASGDPSAAGLAALCAAAGLGIAALPTVVTFAPAR